MRSQYPIGNIAFYRHDISRMDMYLLICNLCIHSVCQYSINFNIGQEYIPCKLCNAPPPSLKIFGCLTLHILLLLSIFHPKLQILTQTGSHLRDTYMYVMSDYRTRVFHWSIRVYSSIYKPTARPSF